MAGKYSRVLLKVSGEALENKSAHRVVDKDTLAGVAAQVKNLVDGQVGVVIIVGAGNILRGDEGRLEVRQAEADDIGMLGTIINALAIQGALRAIGLKAHAFSAIKCDKAIDFYTRRAAIKALDEGSIVIVGGGTSNPFFTTDSAAALRALELDVDAILMAKNGVDGVYTADPHKDTQATLIKKTTYMEILTHDLKVIDATAAGLLLNSKVVTRVFEMKPENFKKVIEGADIGTTVTA